MKKEDFKDVFTPPFEMQEFCYLRILDNKNRFSFQTHVDEELTKKCLDKLNGLIDKKPNKEFYINPESTIEIMVDGHLVFMIRGWGRLTGIGGLNLDDKTASNLQDDFAKWIVETLNK